VRDLLAAAQKALEEETRPELKELGEEVDDIRRRYLAELG
jgi:hypothetical protein